MTYVYHAVQARPRRWASVAHTLRAGAAAHLESAGGRLYGAFRSQIGGPRDELSLITWWPEASQSDAERALFATAGDDVVAIDSRPMQATLRPTAFAAPTRQGNFAFRL